MRAFKRVVNLTEQLTAGDTSVGWLARRPAKRTTSKQVQVNVEHRLPGSLIAIHDDTITLLRKSFLPCDFLRRQKQTANDCPIVIAISFIVAIC